ncbi:AAA family ATPase [Weissella minor]|uniref:AAA family ATPase n=1 Tax=Weissella minor TaxID=1620 RepID=UPI003AF2AC84
MLTNVDLPNDRFTDEVMPNLKKRNYIFGKNGTGKTTLTNLIKEQNADPDDVYVFDGYEHLIQETDEGLDTIALGGRNNKLLDEIKSLNEQIADEQEKIDPSEENMGSIYQEWENANSKKDRVKGHYDDLYKLKANEINSELSLGHGFNRRSLSKYVPGASDRLTEAEVETQKQTLRSDVMKWSRPEIVEIDFSKLVERVTQFCERNLLKAFDPNFESSEIEDWVKEGYQIYKEDAHVDTDHCFFCMQKLPTDRITDLGRYFDNGVLQLENDGNLLVQDIQKNCENLRSIELLNTADVYPDLRQDIEPINELIKKYKADGLNVLEKLSHIVVTKMKSKFSNVEKPAVELVSKEELDKKLDVLGSEMENYSSYFQQAKETAKDKLKKHRMYVAVTSNELTKVSKDKEDAEAELETANLHKQSVNDKIKNLQTQVSNLIEESSDEKEAVDDINKILKSLGNDSFKLEYVSNPQLELKGQYKVRGLNDDQIRSIHMLSTGELNLIAFLWFVSDLRSKILKRGNDNLVVVFDDPMNSNDDTSQYIMISELNRLMRDDLKSESQTFILTHNIQFYAQLKPISTKASRDSIYKLYKVNGKTSVQEITSPSEDFTTTYEMLWDELVFAKSHGKINFMWNTMRRILETYNRFMFSESSPSTLGEQIKGSTNKSIYAGLLKSLHVNSHIGYETDVDLSNITSDALWETFASIFDALGGVSKTHFETYVAKAKKKEKKQQ